MVSWGGGGVLGDFSSLEGFVHARSVPLIRLIHLYSGLYT